MGIKMVMLYLVAALAVVNAADTPADCDLAKITVQKYTSNTCGTKSTADSTKDSGTFLVYTDKNKASGTYTKVNDKCFKYDKDGSSAKHYGAVCTSAKFTIYEYADTDTACAKTKTDVTSGADLKWDTCITTEFKLQTISFAYVNIKMTTTAFATGAAALKYAAVAATAALVSQY